MDQPDAYELIDDGVAGGEGVIWRALDHHLRAPALCAVKMLAHPSAADRRLLDENKRLLQHLSPRNVVRVHDVLYGSPPHPLGRPDRTAPLVAYVIMDWVEGPTLRQVGAGHPATAATIMQRLRYIAQLAGALADLMPLNANATLHRDIKPSNCIIHERHGLVLIDVTTLRRADDGFDPSGMHTPEYAAPEVRAAPRRARSVATEMYSLGAVAAFCLTGSDPHASGPETSRSRWVADLMHAASEAGIDEPETFVRHLISAMDPVPAKRPADLVAWSQGLIRFAIRSPSPLSRMAPVGVSTLPPPGDSRTGRSSPTPSRGNSRTGTSSQRRRAVRPAAVGTVATAVLLTVVGSAALVNGWLPAGERADDQIVAVSPPATSASLPVVGSSSPTTRASASSPALTPPPASPSGKVGGSTGVRRSSSAPSRAPATVPTPDNSAGSKPRTDTTKQCQAASSPGELKIGAGLQNRGGPNWVPAPCDAIWLTLT
ncbi:protein kinase, partial [Actinoplanes sp. NPDC051633]|uniref:serine/threonine protein kinase n=1 Tax=Actinoplanes sp. NPDC051633 TaxID=3155670 RepID=UPI0034498D7A